jgi:hypothetical protein
MTATMLVVCALGVLPSVAPAQRLTRAGVAPHASAALAPRDTMLPVRSHREAATTGAVTGAALAAVGLSLRDLVAGGRGDRRMAADLGAVAGGMALGGLVFVWRDHRRQP